ncbi:MAG TPA: PIG-L family deacetylase [Blastocatellia bacterium]|jgi:LmbE family N-acetylglucosaminyl deacetylase|nr:PIG-L family deacetylase [Blastocatellia bacterium]
MRRIGAVLLVLALALQCAFNPASADTRPAPEDRGATGLALLLRRLQTIASALHTGAHPDDESTDLLAYLARGEGARAAYLSLNRGEGGQNGIGPELWEGLGVIRTEELLAARKLDGAEQYFTRAFDFGFTRSAEETLQKWNREEILGDMVRVIRMMRPLVVVNGFTGTAADGHGQHQVAGMLTPEAIKAAADPNRFPEQIAKEGLQPWRVLKVYGRRFGQTSSGQRAEFDVGVYDPALGRSYAELAADGRSRHRSQDFGMIQARGSQMRSFPRLQSSVQSPDVEKSLFEGIDVTITGVAGFAGNEGGRMLPALTRIKEIAAKALAEFRIEKPEAIAPHLAAGLREVRGLRAALTNLDPVSRATVDGMLARKEQEFNNALAKSHGVIVDALSNTEIVTPGESVDVMANVYIDRPASGENGSNAASPKIQLDAPAGWRVQLVQAEEERQAGAQAFVRGREKADTSLRFRATVPDNEQPTQPYWLTKPRVKDQFDWDDSMPRNLPFAPAIAHARVELTLDGERVVIDQPVEYRFADKTFGEIRRELKVAPALTLTVHPSLLVIPAGPAGDANRPREISVEITHNARRATNGAVKLVAPQGWKVEADDRPLAFTRQNEKTARTFKVTPPGGATGAFDVRAVAEVNGREYSNGYSVISYPHIESHLIYREATTKAEVFDVKVARGLKVGYVMGSGDDGPEALRQMGVEVKMINGAELASGDLSVYDTIVLGIRVYEVNEDVTANNKRLLDYVSNGGTLIVQYNKTEYANGNFAPYPVRMARSDRVTDENAPIAVLVPDHPLFNFPNKITADDWKGWTQERGLYFLSDWDSHYAPLLASSDYPGDQLKGGQLIAQYGKGNYIYTAYAWFRQFPAGVPGAYRLFANLVSLPKMR